MRNMSFFHTQEQVLAQTKDVTRRLGWLFLKPGDVVQPIVKGQGLKKGETVEYLGCPIQIVTKRREPLDTIDQADIIREGFLDMTPPEFVAMFCQFNKCSPDTIITRIEYVYVLPPPARR